MINMNKEKETTNDLEWIECIYLDMNNNACIAILLPFKIVWWDNNLECYRPKKKYEKKLRELAFELVKIEISMKLRTASYINGANDMEFLVSIME